MNGSSYDHSTACCGRCGSHALCLLRSFSTRPAVVDDNLGGQLTESGSDMQYLAMEARESSRTSTVLQPNSNAHLRADDALETATGGHGVRVDRSSCALLGAPLRSCSSRCRTSARVCALASIASGNARPLELRQKASRATGSHRARRTPPCAPATRHAGGRRSSIARSRTPNTA